MIVLLQFIAKSRAFTPYYYRIRESVNKNEELISSATQDLNEPTSQMCGSEERDGVEVVIPTLN